MGVACPSIMYQSAVNPSLIGYQRSGLGSSRGSPLQRYTSGEYTARAAHAAAHQAQYQNLASIRSAEALVSGASYHYESKAAIPQHEASRITWLEENNTRLQQQVSHLTLELKSAGTGGGVCPECPESAQTILQLQEQLEQAHKAEQELVKTLDAARIKSEEGLLAQIAKRDAEIARLNALLVSGDNSAEIEKLQRELAAEKKAGVKRDADLQVSLDMIADLKAELQLTEKQLAGKKSQLNDAQLDLVASDAQLQDAQEEIARLHSQLAALQRAGNTDSAAEAQIVQLNSEIARKNSEISQLKALIAQLNTEVEKSLNMIADQQDEIKALKAQLALSDNGLSADFDFGRRVFQCVVPNPGVGYRNTPAFPDKNKDGTGPQNPQVVVADRICQGPNAVFIRCTSGKGWLPISNPDGKQQILKHVGKESDTNMANYELADGSSKISPKRKVEWYKKSSRAGSNSNSGSTTPRGGSGAAGGGSPPNKDNRTSALKDMMTKK